MTDVTDDPTMKVCPRCDGKLGVWNDRSTWSDCDCFPIGRVPLDTGELLEAFDATQDRDWQLSRGSDGWTLYVRRPGEAFGWRPVGRAVDKDHALRAALRAVTP